MQARARVLAAGAAVVLLVACGSSGSSKSSSSSSSGGNRYGSSGSSSSSTAKAAAANATVRLADSSFGKILVDGDGKTLYLYANNTGTTNSVSAPILAAWPPLKAQGTPTAGEGLDTAKLTTAQQSDGPWVVYNGNLLYRFSGDSAAGQTKGQGLGGVWWVVSAAGAKVTS